MAEDSVIDLHALPPPVRDALRQLLLALLDTVRPAGPAQPDPTRYLGSRARGGNHPACHRK